MSDKKEKPPKLFAPRKVKSKCKSIVGETTVNKKQVEIKCRHRMWTRGQGPYCLIQEHQ